MRAAHDRSPRYEVAGRSRVVRLVVGPDVAKIAPPPCGEVIAGGDFKHKTVGLAELEPVTYFSAASATRKRPGTNAALYLDLIRASFLCPVAKG